MGRIVIATPFESRLAKRGTRLPTLADLLVARGHDVEYVTTNFSHARKEYYSREEIERCTADYPYETTVLKVPGYRENVSVGRVLSHLCLSVVCFRYLAKRLRPIDLLIIPSRPPDLLFAAFLLKRLRSVKVLMDITDLWPDTLDVSPRWRYWLFKAYCEIFQRPSIRSFDCFGHISPCADPWLRRYAPGAESCFIPLGYDEDRWSGASPARPDKGPIRMAYVGTLTYHFDLRPILRAMKTADNLELTVIGDGDRRAELEKLADELGLSGVRFAGRLSPEEVVRELAEHHMGLSPEVTGVSVIPNKIFDYIASYLPILVLGKNDSARYVKEKKIGWTLPFDDGVIGEFFKSISHEELRERISRVEKIRPEYSKTHLYIEYVDRIEKALEGRPTP